MLTVVPPSISSQYSVAAIFSTEYDMCMGGLPASYVHLLVYFLICHGIAVKLQRRLLSFCAPILLLFRYF